MKHIHTFLGILLFFALTSPVFSQKDTEFWFVAPEIAQASNNLDRPVAFRFSTYGSPAIVSISQPANAAFPIQTISLAANSSGKLEFPPLFNLVENTPPNTVLNKGFFIKSTAPITAYYEIIGTVPNNPELFSLKGKNALGTTFYVPFQNVTENSSAYTPTPYAAFDIVATENNTTVTISPTQPIVGSPTATPLTVVLNKGQTYSARALSQAAGAHPTGSKVVADKPVAITMKDDLLEGATLFGGFCRDVMGDQIVPVEKVGTRYVVQKGFLDGDERAFVVATVPNTQVSMDGVVQGTINAGQTLELVITSGSHFIESTAPVYVLQMTGLNCEVAGEILPALDCSGSKEVRFVRSTNQEFHMFLVTRSGNQGGFALNGNAGLIPASAFSPVPGSNGDFVAAVISYSTLTVVPGQSSVVSNTQGEFQMGFLDGGLTTGCRYGFFSDFGNQVKIENDIVFCPGSSVTIDGVTYNQPGTVIDTIPGTTGCDTALIYNLQYAPGDLSVELEEVFCQDGALKVRYSMCKLGSGPWPATVSLLFSPQNPTAEFMSFALAYQINTNGADSCISGIQTISDLPIGDNEPLFVLINVDTISGIVSLDDFPAATDECNYYNNFDSIVVSLPDAPVLDLGPDVILCSDSTVVFSAGSGFVNYFWQDGSDEATFAATAPGIYWVIATDSCGSIQIDSVLLSVSLLPDTQFPDSAICFGSSVALSLPGFDTYEWVPAAGLSCSDCADVVISPATTTQYSLLATTVEGCELRDTFVITIKPIEMFADTIEFCPGEFVTIGGVNYDQSGIVEDTTAGSNGCDKITTYTLIRLPQPVVFSTVAFCKGDTVFIAGNAYTQPGVVMDTIPGTTGCLTIATYTLVYLDDPDAVLTIDCIDDINIATQPGTGSVAIDYDLPVTASDCVCPGVSLALTEGLPSGSLFPITTTKVCYEASDSCGNTAKCCFNVTVREEQPCDVKEIGCMKYELLDIRRNINTLNLTYRVRVTNKCDNKMIYTAIEIPDGTLAVAPANNSVYTSEDGRQYDVRNPNYSPFYSIRFKSTNDSISGGNSDIFQYTLPPQTDVDYIHVTSRLYPQIFYEAYLNTFNCPIELVDDTPRPGDERSASAPAAGLKVFPNPTSGTLYADLSGWRGQQLRISLTDARGQLLQQQYVTADLAPQHILLPEGLADGLYFFEATAENGEKRAARIVLKQ